MTNPFNWRHPIYALDGLMLGALYGLLAGLFLFVILIAASSFIPNADIHMTTFFYYIPLIITGLGAGVGYFTGLVFSHDKEEKEEKASQLPIITLPQATGTQTPIIVVPQQPQQSQVPQIVVVPQATGQQPVVVVPQQPQQK